MVMKKNSKNRPTLVQSGYEVKSESTLKGGHFRQENIVLFFGYILVYFEGSFSLISYSVLITYKMDFDTKASNIILIIFQIKITFQQNVLFEHTYVYLNEKNIHIFL
jgi:hypothetical protein